MTNDNAVARTLNRRTLLRSAAVVGGVAAAPAAMAGCSRSGSTGSKPSGGGSGGGKVTTVKFWTVVEGPDDEAFQKKIFKQWMKDHPDVNVDIQIFPSAQYGNAMQLAFTGGKDTPDVFRVGPGARLDDAYPKGWAAPLDDFITDEFSSRFPDWCYKDPKTSPLYRKGHPYAVPRADPYVEAQRPMYVNADVLSDSGFDAPPKTWTEFHDMAAKITADGKGKKFGASILGTGMQWITQNFAGPEPYTGMLVNAPLNLLTGKPSMADQSVLDTMVFWQKVAADKILTPGWQSWKPEQAIQQMAGGRLGMYIYPLFQANQLRKANPKLNLVLAPPPMPDSARAGSVGPVDAAPFWIMSSKSTVKKAAWQVMDFLGSVAFQRPAFQQLKQISIIPAVYDGIEVDPDTKKLREMAKDLVRTRPDPALRDENVRMFYAELTSKGPKPTGRDTLFAALTRGSGFGPIAKKYDQTLSGVMAPLLKKYKLTEKTFAFPDWDPLKDYVQK